MKYIFSKAMDCSGMVLIVAMVVLVVLTVLGLGAVLLTTTDIKIAGNLRTSTEALYVAEGGMEVVEGNLNSSATSNLSATSGTSNNTQIYTVGSSPKTTITNPLNWIDTSWYTDEGLTTLLETSSAEGAWPLYKKVSVGDEYAFITLKRPTWFYSLPEKIIFREIQSIFVGSNPKKIEADIEVRFENNLLAFQTFKNPSSPTSDIDNISNNSVAIGDSGYDLGIDASLDKITGICTNDSTAKALMIYRDADSNLATSDWTIVGEPEINSVNKTFCLSSTQGKLYSPYSGSTTEPVVKLDGSDYVGDDTLVATLNVVDGQIYKVELVNTSSLAKSSGNLDSTSGLWVAYTYDKW